MIQIESLTKTYSRGADRVRALRGVSCHIAPGSFTFVVGPSGSGKSTLLQLIGALDDPTKGAVIVDDTPLHALTPKQRDRYRRRDVGFVFQSFNLLANLTALENVLVPEIPNGISAPQRRDAVELLERIGLGDRLDHRPSQLSGGEQQRVAVARALLKHPKIVLADEPTGELDSQTGAELFSHLRRLSREQGTTVVVVTHDERYLAQGDRRLTLLDGQLAHDQTFTNVGHPPVSRS